MITNKTLNLTVILSLLTTFLALSQENEYKIVNGEIVNSSQKSIAFVQIVSQKTSKGTISREDGKFNIRVLKIDTLIFSAIGYQTIKMAVSHFQTEQNYITLEPIVYMIGEVNIKDLRWQELQHSIIDMKLTPLERNILVIDGLPDPFMELVQIKPNLVNNPISAIYELLKKENIRKRKQARWNDTYNKTWIIKK